MHSLCMALRREYLVFDMRGERISLPIARRKEENERAAISVGGTDGTFDRIMVFNGCSHRPQPHPAAGSLDELITSLTTSLSTSTSNHPPATLAPTTNHPKITWQSCSTSRTTTSSSQDGISDAPRSSGFIFSSPAHTTFAHGIRTL